MSKIKEWIIKEKKETRFGKLIANTKYSDYSIENQALRDSDTFINRYPLKQCSPCCVLTYEGNNIMVHLFYISYSFCQVI